MSLKMIHLTSAFTNQQESMCTSITTVPSYRYIRTADNHVSRYSAPSRTIPRANLFDKFFDNIPRLLGSSTKEVDSTGDGGHEASNFVKLDPESNSSLDGSGEESTFGPLAMLAVGLLKTEFAALEELMSDLGAQEVLVVPCTNDMLEGTLGEALSTSTPPLHEDSALGTRRVVFLSGMYSSEVIDVVGAVREMSVLPDMAFAAAVPKSWDRNLKELVQDVYSDHAAMKKRRVAAALDVAQEAAED